MVVKQANKWRAPNTDAKKKSKLLKEIGIQLHKLCLKIYLKQNENKSIKYFYISET